MKSGSRWKTDSIEFINLWRDLMKRNDKHFTSLSGTPWHVGYLSMEDGDYRRDKRRCKNFELGKCMIIRAPCLGSSHCPKYSEIYSRNALINMDKPRDSIAPLKPNVIDKSKPEKRRKFSYPQMSKEAKMITVERGDRVTICSLHTHVTFEFIVPHSDRLPAMAAPTLGARLNTSVFYNGCYYKVILIKKKVW